MRLAIDFDNTLAITEFPKIITAVPYGFAYLRVFQTLGMRIILNTCREDHHLTDAVNFCANHGITFFAVNENVDHHWPTNGRKVWADVYIDDKNLNIPLIQHPVYPDHVDWHKVGPAVIDKFVRSLRT